MRITRYTDYSLRVLMYLDINREAISTIQEIADRFDISKNHLTKVVHNLQRNGYVTTLRGKGGGLRLACAPAKISLGQVVRDMESDLELVECFGAANQCVISPSCALANIFSEALDAFFKILDQYSLQDLTDERNGLTQYLLVNVESHIQR